jgi:hypothetical protein
MRRARLIASTMGFVRTSGPNGNSGSATVRMSIIRTAPEIVSPWRGRSRRGQL